MAAVHSDAENRLVSATAGGQTTTLTYDPLGRLWQVVKPVLSEVEGCTPNTRFLSTHDVHRRQLRRHDDRSYVRLSWTMTTLQLVSLCRNS